MWLERELEPLLLCFRESAFTPYAFLPAAREEGRQRGDGVSIKIPSHGPVMEVTLGLRGERLGREVSRHEKPTASVLPAWGTNEVTFPFISKFIVSPPPSRYFSFFPTCLSRVPSLRGCSFIPGINRGRHCL